ncbi:MAG: PilZ domain-containing protein [Acidobacteriota bacterium]
MSFLDPRRLAPRIAVDGLCGVVAKDDLRHAAMVELSAIGLRIELPFDRRAATRTIQLEIELPGIDEIVWARGHVTYAHLSPLGGIDGEGQPRLWCRAGIHLEAAAWRDRRMLRDYVLETRRARATRPGCTRSSPASPLPPTASACASARAR